MKPALKMLVLALALLASCSGNQRQKTLKAALVSVEAAQESFIAWDAAHQRTIVLTASTAEEGEAALQAYREKRRTIEAGFEVAYQGIAAAALEHEDVSLREVLDRIDLLHKALLELTD